MKYYAGWANKNIVSYTHGTRSTVREITHVGARCNNLTQEKLVLDSSLSGWFPGLGELRRIKIMSINAQGIHHRDRIGWLLNIRDQCRIWTTAYYIALHAYTFPALPSPQRICSARCRIKIVLRVLSGHTRSRSNSYVVPVSCIRGSQKREINKTLNTVAVAVHGLTDCYFSAMISPWAISQRRIAVYILYTR